MAPAADGRDRRSIRLKGYDYRQAGAYFVTICALERAGLFGKIVDGEMSLNAIGDLVARSWRWLGEHHPYVNLDAWVVMPNHLHGILVITGQGSQEGAGDPRTATTAAPSSDRGGSRTTPTAAQTAGRSTPTAIPPGRGGSRTAPVAAPTTVPTTAPAAVSPIIPGAVPSPDRGGSRTAPTDAPAPKPLGRLIGAFKTVSTKQVNTERDTPGAPLWQRNYYEHIIRDDRTLDRIRAYIAANPAHWADDAENPARLEAAIRQSLRGLGYGA